MFSHTPPDFVSPAARRFFFPFLIASCALTAGCGGLGRSTSPNGAGGGAETQQLRSTADGVDLNGPNDGDGTSIFNRRPERRVVEVKVHRISAPRGTFTQQDAIWKLVSGRLPSAASALHLSDNGFRAAIGLEAHRQTLLAELQALPDLRIAVDQVVPDTQRTIELEIGSCGEHEVVFYLDRAGGLHGLDFVEAKARLRLTLEWRSLNPDELWLRLTPELEEPPGPIRWEMTPNGPQMAPERRTRAFDELAFDAAIPPGGFLLLGPTATVYDRPLLARPFFIESPPASPQATPDQRENLFVVSPVLRVVKPEPPLGNGASARGE